MTHPVARLELGDRRLLPVRHVYLLSARDVSLRTRQAHTTNGICNGRRPYAAARSRAGRERQSIAIWMFAGNTATNTSADASAPAFRVEGRATATAHASSATPLA